MNSCITLYFLHTATMWLPEKTALYSLKTEATDLWSHLEVMGLIVGHVRPPLVPLLLPIHVYRKLLLSLNEPLVAKVTDCRPHIHIPHVTVLCKLFKGGLNSGICSDNG